VESVSNRFLERPHRLTRAQTAALEAAGLQAPDHESPNWYVDLHGSPPAVAAGLLVRLLEIHDPGLRRGFRIRTVGDEREPAKPEVSPHHPSHGASAPVEGPERGTTVEGIAGPMLVVQPDEADVDALAIALAELVEPWLIALEWDRLAVVIDQVGCPFAAEITPSGTWPTARLLPYVEAPADVEATLLELGWHQAEEAGQPWWRQSFLEESSSLEVLQVVVETLHAVCGLQLEQPVLVQVAPA
jgi:hypothetical protein